MYLSLIQLLLLPLLCLANPEETAAAGGEFPSPLTKSNFKSVLSSGLHLVEFYSPYCSHCQHFAPTWEKTWHNFHQEGQRLGVGMAQVDCVESGDLCQEENIRAYPALKLYGPDGYLKDYPKSYKRSEEHLMKFMKKSVLDMADLVHVPESKSKFLSTDELLLIMGEVIQEPILISFWPSYDLKDLDKIDELKFKDAASVEETVNFQRKWRVVSHQLESSDIKTAHFNCLSNKKICKSLGFKGDKPEVVLVLPNVLSGKVIVYDQKVHLMNPKDVIEFAERTYENFKVPSIDSKGVLDLVTVRLRPLSSIPQDPETYFIYLYDESTVSHEDFELFPFLTQTLASLPHTRLFKSNDTTILGKLESQRKHLYDVINYNETEPKREFNEQRSIIELSTTFPTLVCFKQHSILSEVYHSSGPSHIRDQYSVLDWIRDNAQQSISELNEDTLRHTLSGIENNQKHIVQFINTTDEKSSLNYLNNFLLAFHDYTDLYSNRTFAKIISGRNAKSSLVEELKKEKDVDQKKVIKALSQEIPHDKQEVTKLLYLDLKENSGLLKKFGLTNPTYESSYKNGDVVILNEKKIYYDSDPYGAQLTTVISPHFLRETLAVTQEIHTGKVPKRLRYSKFTPAVQLMNDIREFGVRGYFVIVLLVVAFKGRAILRYMGTWRRHEGKGLGILDDPSKYE